MIGMWRRFVIAAAAVMVSLAAVEVSSAQEVPATAPAPVAPTTQPLQPAHSIVQIQQWFDNLASSEPQARDDARTELLGLGKIDLDALREVVRRSLPLAPSQSGVLHDIVVHVYLAATNDQSMPQGFLGVMLDPSDNGVQENMELSKVGVYIFDCMPGYCGYRWLRPADVVAGIFAQGELVRLQQKEDLKNYVRNTLPGSALKMQVLRQGRMIEVTVRVDSRPPIADDRFQPLRVDEWRNQRMGDAEKYWEREFAPLLGGMT
jgi:hypothetical protein